MYMRLLMEVAKTGHFKTGSHFTPILLLFFNKPVIESTVLLSESSCIRSRKQLFYHFTFVFVLGPLPALTLSLKSLFNVR